MGENLPPIGPAPAQIFAPGAFLFVHGVWFGSPSGIYLDSPTDGLRKVSDRAAYPGNGCM